MEISNLSSAWWLIAIVVLVIVTRVVLYYRAKAKRKDEMSKLLRTHDENVKKIFCDLNGNKINKPHIAPSGKVPDFIPPKPPPVRIIKGDKVVNQKEVDEYNANSMYVLSSSYSNTGCKHVPENPNIILTSCPPQQKCKKCGKFYFI